MLANCAVAIRNPVVVGNANVLKKRARYTVKAHAMASKLVCIGRGAQCVSGVETQKLSLIRIMGDAELRTNVAGPPLSDSDVTWERRGSVDLHLSAKM